jgi:hypothetical protein
VRRCSRGDAHDGKKCKQRRDATHRPLVSANCEVVVSGGGGAPRLEDDATIRPRDDGESAVWPTPCTAQSPSLRVMKMKTKMWIALLGMLLVLLALGGWAVDAIRWPFASARLQWRLALSTR